jgi:hypothetical protein
MHEKVQMGRHRLENNSDVVALKWAGGNQLLLVQNCFPLRTEKGLDRMPPRKKVAKQKLGVVKQYQTSRV